MEIKFKSFLFKSLLFFKNTKIRFKTNYHYNFYLKPAPMKHFSCNYLFQKYQKRQKNIVENDWINHAHFKKLLQLKNFEPKQFFKKIMLKRNVKVTKNISKYI